MPFVHNETGQHYVAALLGMTVYGRTVNTTFDRIGSTVTPL